MHKNITAIKDQLGDRLCILAHHYQNDHVLRHADIVGDSLELARHIPGLGAQYIVFCGVHFMAETAAILAGPDQRVYAPDPSAGCVMSNMAPAHLLAVVLERLNAQGQRIIPLTYVNSSAAVKAVCGQFGGSVCTSANAPAMLAWALDQGDAVLFLPDAYLGQNTANILGLDPSEIQRIDIRAGGQRVLPPEAQTRLLLWPGLCAVHAKIRPEHLDTIRAQNPGAIILVHPECAPEVVNKADGAGSTSFLIQQAEQAAPGSTIFMGTECNLVYRLQDRYPEKSIHPLHSIWCSNMAKTTEEKLLSVLENLEQSPVVQVDTKIIAAAGLALERMLAVCC